MDNAEKRTHFINLEMRFYDRSQPLENRARAAIEAALYLRDNGPIREEILENETPDFWLERAWSVLGAKLGKGRR